MSHTPSELEVLRERLAAVERALAEKDQRSQRLRRVARWSAVVVLFAAGGVFAANGNCPNGLPFCFAPNSPAHAASVNQNFMQLKEWLEAKVGSISASTITSTGVTVNGPVAVTGDQEINGRLIGTNSAGNFHLDTRASGNQGMYLNWFSGNNGVYFGNGNQAQVARLDGAGNLSAKTVFAGASGGNVPHQCVVRTSSNSYNAACAAGEIAVGGGGRCYGLWRLTESLPWGGPGEGDAVGAGGIPRAWRAVCQVWGSAGTYAVPQMGVFAVCCRY